jgi:hypothetical protein
MAKILKFECAPRQAPASTAATDRSADIVLFPGVRYERQAAPGATKPKRGKRNRDTIQLEG